MKKRWIGVLALALSAALLAGCDQRAANNEQSSGESSEESWKENIVTLGEYKGLPLSASLVEYSDDEIEIQTKQMYFYYIGDMEDDEKITDRPVENLDMTNIDFVGKQDGVAFEGGTAQGASLLIGSGQFIEGFEEGLIGVMPGETVDLNLSFPDPYLNNPDLAGQEVVFTVTVNFILEMKDGRVSEIGNPNVTTVEDLRAYVKSSMESQARSEYLAAAENEIMDTVIGNTVFTELPEDMLAENRETYGAWLDRQASNFGMTAQAYLEMYGMDYEATLDQYAEQYTKQILVVHAIADIEGLNISEEALDARLGQYAEQVGVTVDELMVSGLTKEDYLESFLYEDVLNFLVENSVSPSIIAD